MQIDTLERTVRLNVGEFANFRNTPRTGDGVRGRWRAKLGQDWHKASALETKKRHPDARFEETIETLLRHKDWSIQLQGRFDQIIPEGDTLKIREVKTIRTALPCTPEELFDLYPEYFTQAATYLYIARLLADYQEFSLSAELLFIGIDDGTAQIVAIDKRDEELVNEQLGRLTEFLNERRESRIRLNEVNIHPAFEELREGQSDLAEQIDAASLRSKTVLIEAPTGFGKTGIVLEHALEKMRSGVYERCIYLTSKSTGQIETVRQLQKMIGQELRFIQMRNRKEHKIESAEHTCTRDRRCDENLEERWAMAGIDPPRLFNDGTFHIDEAKEIGSKTGVCPYALTKSCLPYAEIWIGDSNYLFGPSSRHVFIDQIGFAAERTLLIIDEAHNLPNRNADALSVELRATDLIFAIEEFRAARGKRHLLQLLAGLVEEIEVLPLGVPLTADQIYTLCDLCEEIERQLDDVHLDYEAIPPFALDTVWKVPEFADRLNRAGPQWLYWCPEPGQLRASCLDASIWTNECLQAFGGTILMSATLDPFQSFCASIGVPERECAVAIGHANWRDDAYDVAIDCRIDTRMRERGNSYETTARTVASLISSSPGTPVTVFFPSYQYAENIKAYLNALDSSLRVSVQPRGVDLVAQEDFIEEALIMSDALFLIVGSSFAEGIDKLGGKTEFLMVVSPCLPEVNPLQNAKMEACPEQSRELSFERVYIIPAMHRIHQALGRVVRAPGQRARVLLHGKRYNEQLYRKRLAPEFQTDQIITNDSSFYSWLH